MNKKKVLIVDDEKNIVELIKMNLEKGTLLFYPLSFLSLGLWGPIVGRKSMGPLPIQEL